VRSIGREVDRLCREEARSCRDHGLLCREDDLLCREEARSCREDGLLCREYGLLWREEARKCREDEALCREVSRSCRGVDRLCRGDDRLCREFGPGVRALGTLASRPTPLSERLEFIQGYATYLRPDDLLKIWRGEVSQITSGKAGFLTRRRTEGYPRAAKTATIPMSWVDLWTG
jgi:hypothetical protein